MEELLRVLYKQIRESKETKDKFESEDLEGVWLGHNRGSNEVLIGTPHGVVRAFSFRKRDENSHWSPILAKGMQGLPKQPDPTRLGSSVTIRVQSLGHGNCAEPVVVSVPQQEVNPRRFRIVPNMLTAYGYTPGCVGWRHKRAGFATARDHSEARRKRIADAINSDSSRRWRQFQERVRQSAVRPNAGSEQVTTQEETTPGDQEIVDHVDAVGAVEP